MSTSVLVNGFKRPHQGLFFAAGLGALQLLAISILYQHNFQFVCRDAAPDVFCAFAGRIVTRVLGVLAALCLFMLARPQAVKLLRERITSWPAPLTLTVFGFALVLAPWSFISDASPSLVIGLAALCWSLGGVMMGAGLLGLVAPFDAWMRLLRAHGTVLAFLILAGLALPEVSDQLQGLWTIDGVTEVTFAAVVWILGMLGYVIDTFPAEKVIGANDFYVAVGPQCSGVEGFALITTFLTLYMFLFRRELRFPHVLLLFPIGIFLSAVLNIVRISVLIMLGFEVSPELAIGGFHSHAGWLLFTCLALGLILASRAIPFFVASDLQQSESTRALPPFLSDPSVAQIFPFIVFMASALLASTFAESPSVIYPLRALAMAAGLGIFWPYLKALPWRLDGLSIGAGVAIAALWVVTAPAQTEPLAIVGVTGGVLVFWVVMRVIGTSILVPIIEELFFRGYLMDRLAGPGGAVRIAIAIGVTSGFFALLHDRWIEAAMAGVIFGLLVMRSKNITDAIVSHAVANGLIAAWALLTGAWHIL